MAWEGVAAPSTPPPGAAPAVGSNQNVGIGPNTKWPIQNHP